MPNLSPEVSATVSEQDALKTLNKYGLLSEADKCSITSIFRFKVRGNDWFVYVVDIIEIHRRANELQNHYEWIRNNPNTAIKFAEKWI